VDARQSGEITAWRSRLREAGSVKAVGSDTRTWIKLTETYRPDPWRGQRYTQWYEEYRQQYRSVKDQYKHVATLLERGK